MNAPRQGGWPRRGILQQRDSQPEINHELLVPVMARQSCLDDQAPGVARHRKRP